MKRSTFLVSACLSVWLVAPYLLLCSTGPAGADEPLKGRVEETGIAPTPEVPAKVIEPMPVPVVRPRKTMQKARVDGAALEGRAESTQLDGRAEDAGADLKAIEAKPDPQTGRLKATVSKDDANLASQDPDAADQELMIEWDRWRNRFLHAIQSGMQEKLNDPSEANLRWDPRARMMVSRFPLGTVAWFACQVTPDRRIVNAKIVHTSGFPGYDQAVLDAIHDLQGSSILRYPRGSRRQIVSQVAGIKTAETAEFRYHKFGDVERHFIPGD
jgi:hypothetical protein